MKRLRTFSVGFLLLLSSCSRNDSEAARRQKIDNTVHAILDSEIPGVLRAPRGSAATQQWDLEAYKAEIARLKGYPDIDTPHPVLADIFHRSDGPTVLAVDWVEDGFKVVGGAISDETSVVARFKVSPVDEEGRKFMADTVERRLYVRVDADAPVQPAGTPVKLDDKICLDHAQLRGKLWLKLSLADDTLTNAITIHVDESVTAASKTRPTTESQSRGKGDKDIICRRVSTTLCSPSCPGLPESHPVE